MSTSHPATSVDPNEVAYYERLADTWWDLTGPFWPLHRLNELRVQYIRDALCTHYGRDASVPSPLLGLDILDVGCGGGILSEAVAAMGARVHGIDVVERNIRVANAHAYSHDLTVRYDALTAEALAQQGAQYDAVLNMEVVEHVADVPRFLGACSALVRANGVMFVATINRTWLSYLFAIVGAEYVLNWLPRGTHQWRRFLTPRELERLLAQDNMDIVAKRGVRINPISKRFALTRWTGVNYMLVAVKRSAKTT